MSKKAALVSVSDRSGLKELAEELKKAGYEILATTGSGKFLQENNIDFLSIEDYTGQKEILGGRVKTLHPKIHAGLLAKRDDQEHIDQLAEDQILSIDIAIVNLYPFIENLKTDKINDPLTMIELVDIGGPTMIRAAAKNFQSVFPVIDPTDYPELIEIIKQGDDTIKSALNFRKKLAVKVFKNLADYNLQIAKYFSNVEMEDNTWKVDSSEKTQELRYGENPHQVASFYKKLSAEGLNWKQLSGKELSYNNFLDFDAAFSLVKSLPRNENAVAIIKHLNPCGVAVNDSLSQALINAKKGDPRSHFGGIIAFNQEVDEESATEVSKDFCEIVIAPSYSETSLNILKKKKNLRIIEISFDSKEKFQTRSVAGGILVQEIDPGVSLVSEAELVSKAKPSDAELRDLQFAWTICAHVKSNAITIVKDNMLVSSGSGQMSRIDSVEIAKLKANIHDHNLNGAVAASDAFFPFEDSVESLAEAGIKAIIVTGGAKRDPEVIELANKLGISLLFTKDRHFKH
ncbi:UNVERIFIED_CONTAM: hypothetical protein GTU68_051086 [Idotea baltica]|nr:hypothetical protein [Idotea baltica]